MELKDVRLKDVLNTLHEAGVLQYTMLIGSNATLFYSGVFTSPDYHAPVNTIDADFLYRNIRKPKDSINIAAILRQAGFIPIINRANETMVFRSLTADYDVEFLVKALGSGTKHSYKIDALGIRAEGLRHLDILDNHPLRVAWENLSIVVPTPAAFVVHKLVINDNRKPLEKKQKDLDAVDYLLTHIKNNPLQVLDLKLVMAELSPSELKHLENANKRLSFNNVFEITENLPETGEQDKGN